MISKIIRYIYNKILLVFIVIKTNIYRLVLKKIGKNVEITKGVRITSPQNVTIMDNVFINNFCLLNGEGGLCIGKNTIIGPYVSIWTSNHIFVDINKPIKDQGNSFKPVTIEDDCWIGSNVIILPGVIINTGSIIGAGSVVTKSTDKFSVYAGNPAKKIKNRND